MKNTQVVITGSVMLWLLATSIIILATCQPAVAQNNKEGVRLATIPLSTPITQTADIGKVLIGNEIMTSSPAAAPPVCDPSELLEEIAKTYAECYGYIHQDSCKVNDLGDQAMWVVDRVLTRKGCPYDLLVLQPVPRIVYCDTWYRRHTEISVLSGSRSVGDTIRAY